MRPDDIRVSLNFPKRIATRKAAFFACGNQLAA